MLSQVCCRWRELALGIPVLWATITDNVSPELASAFFYRSRNLPLNVSLTKRDSSPPFNLHDISERIRSLDWTVLERDESRIVANLPPARELLSFPMPALENLALRGILRWNEDQFEEGGVLFADHLPKLRTLCLHAPLWFPANVVPTLTHLCLSDVDISLNVLHNILGHYPNLQHFAMITAISDPDMDEDNDPPNLPLPHISRLSFSDVVWEFISRILSAMVFKNETEVAITIADSTEVGVAMEPGDRCWGVQRGFSSSLTSAYLDVSPDNTLSFIAIGNTGGVLRLVMSAFGQEGEECAYYTSLALKLPLQHVQQFIVHAGAVALVSAFMLQRVMGAMRNLEEVVAVLRDCDGTLRKPLAEVINGDGLPYAPRTHQLPTLRIIHASGAGLPLSHFKAWADTYRISTLVVESVVLSEQALRTAVEQSGLGRRADTVECRTIVVEDVPQPTMPSQLKDPAVRPGWICGWD